MSQLLNRPMVEVLKGVPTKFILSAHGMTMGIPTGYEVWKGPQAGNGVTGQPVFDIRFSHMSHVDLSELIDGYSGTNISHGLTQMARRMELDRQNMILPDHRLALALVNQFDQVYLECLFQKTGITKIYFYGSFYQKNNKPYCLCILRDDLEEHLKWSIQMMPASTFVVEDDMAMCFVPRI